MIEFNVLDEDGEGITTVTLSRAEAYKVFHVILVQLEQGEEREER